jgi:hypothetical protein
MFEALAAYANMGDTPTDWRRFRLMYPEFFPSISSEFKFKEPPPEKNPWPGYNMNYQNLTEWMYGFAESWWNDFKDFPPDRRPVPPLLWYRNRLRDVWARNDQHGYSLSILLGFECEADNIAKEHPGETPFEPVMRPMYIPGQPLNLLEQKSYGLPQGKSVVTPGKPVIDGVSGAIRWEFGCDMQQAVYELMQDRWRAKVCPKCGRFFIALKTAQTFCSVPCSEDSRRERALTWWNETGSKRRSQAKTKMKRKKKGTAK